MNSGDLMKSILIKDSEYCNFELRLFSIETKKRRQY